MSREHLMQMQVGLARMPLYAPLLHLLEPRQLSLTGKARCPIVVRVGIKDVHEDRVGYFEVFEMGHSPFERRSTFTSVLVSVCACTALNHAPQ